ncbi:DUF1003 domain-containing protein [Yeosuana sp.]|uniref:DUF1003 domain-containing protein n=1 Tax=Yeosuana sp. TaxID=2529388 RepID=UPI0040552111|tara:strand:+ start:11380 stop:11628 length:249 start_codon:yes stop_codon:yes gene_type:complete
MEIRNTNHIYKSDLKKSEEFATNMVRIFLMPLLLVGQNLQGKRSEIRAENDYQVNIKAEKEIAHSTKEIQELKQMISELNNK